jgi:hypothetical protein
MLKNVGVCGIAMLASVPLLAACGATAAASGAAAAVTYYVSPSGSNSAAGTSPAAPWRTLARVNAEKLVPGDRVLLQGGQQFTGGLIFTKAEAGDAAKPVVVGSYGQGRARIVSAAGSGVVIYDTAGIDVEDLVITGRASGRPQGIGISLYSDLPDDRKLTHVLIDDVDVSDFVYGIGIGGGNGATGFRDVWVRNSALHGNLDDGLISYAPVANPGDPRYAHEDIYISHVHAYQNLGDPEDTSNNTGNGIVLGDVQRASITFSTADDNGGKGAAGEGPVGIWAYDSSGVVIAHDLSYGNQTANSSDGDGFGLDENTFDCYLEYNLSYDNAGAGYLLYSAQTGAEQQGNVISFNISSGDGRRSRYYGGITLLGQISDAAIYQNTVVMPPVSGGSNPALRLVGTARSITVRNNIFLTEENGPIVVSATALLTSAAQFQANDYFTASGGWALDWGAASYRSLAAWRSASGQELLDNRPTGFAVDPQLAGPTLGLHATANGPAAAAGFVLLPTSPLRGAGLALSSLPGVPSPAVDFSGASISALTPNIGAE